MEPIPCDAAQGGKYIVMDPVTAMTLGNPHNTLHGAMAWVDESPLLNPSHWFSSDSDDSA